VEKPADWLPAIANRLTYLIENVGTDISSQAIQGMVNVIADPVFEGTPMPLISPAGEAGIAVEFRGGSVELHVEIDEHGHGSAYVFQEGGVEWEGPVSELPDGLDKWAWRLGQVAR